MKAVLRLALVDPVENSRNALKTLLMGLDTVWVEAECSRYEFFYDLAAQCKPDLAVVSLDADQEKALAVIGKLARGLPASNVLAISSNTDGSLILQAIRAGAKEFLAQPVKLEEFLAALHRLSQDHQADRPAGSHTVVAVAGTGGGVGSTSLAVNLGCSLAHGEHHSVVLIDLDLALGDADACLDIIPDYTLMDVAQNISRLDFTLLKRSLTKHSSGLFLLPRPVNLSDTRQITADALSRVLGLLKATFTHLILDLSKSYSELDLVALRAADVILLVTQLDLPALRNVVRLMLAFAGHEGLTEKVRIVVNRVGLDGGQISLKKAKETIGREVFWQLPNDFATMIESRNNGLPLLQYSPRSRLTQSILELASAISPSAEKALQSRKERRRLIPFLS